VLIARTTCLRSRALLRFALAAIGAGIALVACAGSGRNADKAATGRETTTAGAPNETETGGKIESGTDAAEAIAPAGVIAYQTDRTGREGVWLIRSDGSDDHEVATDVPDEHLHPDWSPDGEHLLFTKRAEHDLLFEANAQGRNARQIVPCDDPCGGDDEASYSPDRRRIAFIRAFGPLADDGSPKECRLAVFDRTSGTVTYLTRDPRCLGRAAFPRWSPDGSMLVYFVDRSDEFGATSTTAVFSIAAKGGKARQLTSWELAGGDADWSPDGKLIVFSTYPLVYFQEAGISNLYTIRSDGSNLHPLTSYKEGETRASHPRWTPDGERIVYVADNGGARELWLVNADGSNPVQITQGGIYTHPVWRPNP
jgi:Tol biopolymer transport system component